MKPYITVKSASVTELIEKKSRFIGRCFPVQTEEAALCLLNSLRKEYYDATHNCYAYIIKDTGVMRCSDDGEPSKTAGVPMLETLKSKNVTDVLCVVTRYFGGILLGAGGLVRAYSKSCQMAVDAAELVNMEVGQQLLLRLDYSRFSALEPYIRSVCEVTGIEYAEEVRVCVSIDISEADGFIDSIRERTDGRCIPERTGEGYYIKG